jgi:hypothetical protein
VAPRHRAQRELGDRFHHVREVLAQPKSRDFRDQLGRAISAEVTSPPVNIGFTCTTFILLPASSFGALAITSAHIFFAFALKAGLSRSARDWELYSIHL